MDFRRPRLAPMKRGLSTSTIIAATLVTAISAAAEPLSTDARADALFATAKQLMASGQLADACPLFEQSKQLAPGVGVSLHLADCYERLGRTASAWLEFDGAERMARQRGDEKRAVLAETRALALEPRLERLTVATSGAPRAGWQVLVDGVTLPTDHWNAALAMDPGDHTVVVNVAGEPSRTLRAHLDPASNAVILRIDEGTVPAVASQTSVSVPAVTLPSEALQHSGDNSWRTWAEVALVGATATGVSFGSFFMIRRAHFIQEGPPADPTLTNQANTAATISFVASGIALTPAFVLFFTAQGSKNQVGWGVAPTPLPGGAGARVLATF